MMLYILGIVFFILALAISIALHEGGHLIVAKKLGLKIPRFFVGFGPTMYSKKIGATEYGVKAIPAGGFVEIMPPDEADPNINQDLLTASGKRSTGTTKAEKQDMDFHKSMLSHVKPWKRVLIFVAGPAVNIVLGVLLLTGAFWATPMSSPINVIDSVNTCGQGVACAAHDAGFQSGDEILSINGVETTDTDAVSSAITPNSTVDVEVLRDGQPQILQVTADEDAMIGINFVTNEVNRTLGESFVATGDTVVSSIRVVSEVPHRLMETSKIIFGAERSDETLSSVVSAGHAFGDTTSNPLLEPEMKASALIAYTGAFNLSIGFINLLPLMPLDGGRIALAFIDSVRNGFRKLMHWKMTPLNPRLILGFSAVSMAVVFSAFAIVVLADIISPSMA